MKMALLVCNTYFVDRVMKILRDNAKGKGTAPSRTWVPARTRRRTGTSSARRTTSGCSSCRWSGSSEDRRPGYASAPGNSPDVLIASIDRLATS